MVSFVGCDSESHGEGTAYIGENFEPLCFVKRNRTDVFRPDAKINTGNLFAFQMRFQCIRKLAPEVPALVFGQKVNVQMGGVIFLKPALHTHFGACTKKIPKAEFANV